jgi:DNA invertase Pin-like site-specific DNA recombinase
MTTTIGYLRRSRITEGNNSIQTQKKMIEDFCETNNLILTQIVVDDGISGSGEKTHKRDGYNSVMKMVEDGEVDNIDTSSPYGRFTINLLSSLYEMELELIRERVKDTLKVKKESGKVYSKTPFGFSRVGDDLVENPKEKRVLRKMLRLKEKGFSYRDISNYLTKNRHKNKSGGKWSRENVYSVMKTYLKNEKITLQFS